MKNRYVVSILALSLTAGLLCGPAAMAAEELNDAAAAAEETVEEDLEAAEEADAGEMEEIQEAAEDSGEVSESSAAEEETAESEKEKSGKKKDVAGDADGLIEDTGKVTSAAEGENLDDVLAEEAAAGAVSFPGFTVDPWKYPPVNIEENTRAIYWYLKEELELNHAAACGVLANIQLEANFRPIALGDGGTSYGICQWHLGRFSRLMDYCRKQELDYNTLEGQLAYLGYELKNYYPHVLEGLEAVDDTAKGAYAAGYLFCYQFEIPDQTAARSQQRGNLAQFEYYPEEIEYPEEEEILKILRETFPEAEEKTESDRKLEVLEAEGMMLPENYEIGLTYMDPESAAAEAEGETEIAEAEEETDLTEADAAETDAEAGSEEAE